MHWGICHGSHGLDGARLDPRHPAAFPVTLRRTTRGILPAVALLLPLAGCMVGPDFEAPTPPLADRFAGSADPSVRTDRQVDERWWGQFGDPALDGLVELAYRQNLTLLAAGTRVLEARAALGVAIGGLYPQDQTIGAGLTFQQVPRNDVTANPLGTLRNFWRSSMAANVAWELDFWGRFRRGVLAADAAYLASIATYDDVLVTLIGDVATTYIGIRTLQQQIAIARANVVRQRRALSIARDRFTGGATSGLDVAQAENILAQTEATIPALTAQMQQGMAALCVLLGMPSQSLAPLLQGSRGIPNPPDNVVVGVPAELLRRRPDIRAAELQAAAQSEQIGMALAQLFPAFQLLGVLGTSATTVGGNRLGNMFNGSAISFAFGSSFSWPIFNYGQITNQVRVQDARLQTLLTQYRDTVLRAQRDVDQALAGYVQGTPQVRALRRAVAAAQQAVDLSMEQYELGSRDFTAVLIAEQYLLQAQNLLATAMGNRATSLANVYRALGGGWQIRAGHGFVDNATREQMRARTNWGRLLPSADAPPAPGLPGPEDRGPSVRPPEW